MAEEMREVEAPSGNKYRIPTSLTGDDDRYAKLSPQSRVGKVIGVVSGKGGVGKSLVTSLLAVKAARSGKKTAILDSDITGPSIPRAFGLHGVDGLTEDGLMVPPSTESGIKVMSLNLLVQNETDPVIWRGPIISGIVTQFWGEVLWGDIDVMFVDMPPGTGDVALTVFQSLPIDGLVIVSSPQELVGMIVEKAVNMADHMDVPVVGMVENMSYLNCPDCGKKIELFGESHLEEIAAKHGIGNIARIPLDSSLAAACDAGRIESVEVDWLDDLYEAIV